MCVRVCVCSFYKFNQGYIGYSTDRQRPVYQTAGADYNYLNIKDLKQPRRKQKHQERNPIVVPHWSQMLHWPDPLVTRILQAPINPIVIPDTQDLRAATEPITPGNNLLNPHPAAVEHSDLLDWTNSQTTLEREVAPWMRSNQQPSKKQ